MAVSSNPVTIVPPATDPVWRSVVTGKSKYALDFLAAKIMLGRLALQIQKDPSAENIAECARTLRDVYAENTNLPSVQKDLDLMFQGGSS